MSVKELRLSKLVREKEQAHRMGLNVKFMVLSLQCSEHCSEHAVLLSATEAESKYDISIVSDSCNCALVKVPLGTDGLPLNKGIVEKAIRQRVS